MVTAAIRATGLPAVRLIAMAQDDRDLRDELRVDVMRLARRIGSDKVPPELLDEAMKIAKSKGMKAARAYIKKVGETL